MIIQSLKMAWSAIRSNKMRSFLTMLGIMIGVMSLVVLVSIADGATSSVTDQISSMGTNYFTVSVLDDKEQPLRMQEVTDLMEEENIALAAPFGQTNVTAKKEYTSSSMTVYGTTAAYSEIMGLTLSQGRFLKTADVENHTNVAVINAYAASEFFENKEPVGEYLSLNGKQYLVVGVLEEEESTIGSTSGRLEAYIPYTSLLRLADNIFDVTTFYVSSEDEKSMDAAEQTLTSILLERFDRDEEAFSIQNRSELMETMESITATLQLMLGGIAAISLLVGGIGIMNIMLVSVTERTREIGIRKAIGADRKSIMLQFLIEALVISLLGCLLGILLSVVILFVMANFVTDISFHISVSVVWIAVIFSAAIGVIFGIYPANKAAKMHPIEALRF